MFIIGEKGKRNNKLFHNHGQRQYIYNERGEVKKIIYHDNK